MAGDKLKSFQLKNFKAVRDSGVIEFTPLTVFIGSNGSGKSSLIEGLETYQAIVENGLDKAMQHWRGFEYIWNQSVPHLPVPLNNGDRPYLSNPMEFCLNSRLSEQDFRASMSISQSSQKTEPFFKQEELVIDKDIKYFRNDSNSVEQIYPGGSDNDGEIAISKEDYLQSEYISIIDNRTIITQTDFSQFVSSWQFLALNAEGMGEPVLQKQTGGQIGLSKSLSDIHSERMFGLPKEQVRLSRNGSNIAEYLLDIKRLDELAFEGIIEAMKFVLPYAGEVLPTLTMELGRNVYLQMTEGQAQIPGWLLSTGTLRILAILALLRHPNPPSLIVIEEIENGLDPSSVGLIVEEIRNVVEEGKSQVIITTHSPYLLDLLVLPHIILVEREAGQPTFRRPANDESLKIWAERFSPGKLYTMGRLSREYAR